MLAGNHDAWVTGALTLDLLPLPRQRMELTWQRAKLSDEQLAWLAARPSYPRRAGTLATSSAGARLRRSAWTSTLGDDGC